MTCYACDNEPTQQCPRCGRPYCDLHGEDFCGVCLQPATGVPSFTLYRGSLLALVVGAILGLWVIIQPASSEGEPRLIVVTPTAAANAGVDGRNTPAAASTNAPGVTPAAGTTPPAGATPSASATRPAGSATPGAGGTPAAGVGEYTVIAGDNLGAVCDKIQKPANMTNGECITAIITLNNLASANQIQIGQVLRVPR